MHDYTQPISKYEDLTFKDCVVQWVWDSIWSEKIRLSDVPKPIRCISTSIYTSAFRMDRNMTADRYLEDIHIMMTDMQDILESCYSTILIQLGAVEDMENGKQAVKDFWDKLEPELRNKFDTARGYGEANLRTMLADKLFEKTGQ